MPACSTAHARTSLPRGVTAVTGVVGVALGGSRAGGDHAPEPGVELACITAPVGRRCLRALAREVTSAEVEVTEPAPGAVPYPVDGMILG